MPYTPVSGVIPERITDEDGSYSEIYYMNDDRETVDKDSATHAEIVQFDKEGNQLGRIYGEIDKNGSSK